MQNKRTGMLIIIVFVITLLSGCSLNSSARPSTEYDSLAALLSAYETKSFTGESEDCSRFIRDLAGIVQKKDKTAVFDDWVLADGSDPEKMVYEKLLTIYGREMTMTIVVQLERNWIGAISLSYEGEDAFDVASALAAACFDRFGGTYQSLQESEKVTDYTLENQIEKGDSSLSFSAIWPKSSIKWSVMVSYDRSGDVPKAIVNVL